jgi:putative transposase
VLSTAMSFLGLYRQWTALLRHVGLTVNRKQVERIWREEGLKVPQKQPKRGR